MALTTLAAVKAYAAITSPDLDAVITTLVERASAAVESYLLRGVLLAPRAEIRDGTGAAGIILADHPVAWVQSVLIDGATIPPGGFGSPGWRLGGRCIVLTGYTFKRGLRNVVISYTGGFDTVPPDIEQACIETVVLMLRRRDHLDVSSKSLAGETVSYITAELSPSAKQMLAPYRRVAPL